MPLSDVEKAALKGFLNSKRGSRALQKHVVEALVVYFVARDIDISLHDLPTSPPHAVSEVDEWLDEWAEYAADAGLQAVSDKGNVRRWMGSSDVPSGATGSRSGKAAAVADALTRKGLAGIDRAAELTIASALAEVEAGELRAQCRSVEVVWILYTGQLPGEEDRQWFQEKRQAASVTAGGEDPKVDIRYAPSYGKLLSKTTVNVLERALE